MLSKHFTAITFLREVERADLRWMRKAPEREKLFCSKSHNYKLAEAGIRNSSLLSDIVLPLPFCCVEVLVSQWCLTLCTWL